jgi:hypothetical protein
MMLEDGDFSPFIDMESHVSSNNVFMELIKKGAEENFMDSGELVPMIFAYKENFPIMMLPAPLGNEQEKDIAYAVINSFRSLDEVDIVAFVSEGWVKSFENEGQYEKGKQVRDYEGREEAIMVTFYKKDETEININIIDRSGEVTEFKGWETHRGGESKGRFV